MDEFRIPAVNILGRHGLGAGAINAACEVLWCNKIKDMFYEAGVSFLLIDGRAGEHIDSIVDDKAAAA